MPYSHKYEVLSVHISPSVIHRLDKYLQTIPKVNRWDNRSAYVAQLIEQTLDNAKF